MKLGMKCDRCGFPMTLVDSVITYGYEAVSEQVTERYMCFRCGYEYVDSYLIAF